MYSCTSTQVWTARDEPYSFLYQKPLKFVKMLSILNFILLRHSTSETAFQKVCNVPKPIFFKFFKSVQRPDVSCFINEVVCKWTKGIAKLMKNSTSQKLLVTRTLTSRLSHTMNLKAFVFTPTVQICRVRSLKDIKYRLPEAIFNSSRTSTFSLLEVPYAQGRRSKWL